MEQDLIFKALADPSRRKLLDQLNRQDGQSLSELEQYLEMSRFGVMKHLRLLEEAELITTEKVGREKHHYLNPVPIQLVYDRWVRKYAQSVTSQLADLKYQLENNSMNDTVTHRYQIYIQTTQEKLWDALTNGAITPSYYFGTTVQTDWQVGSDYRYVGQNGTLLDGKIIEIDPPNKIVQTFNARWEPEAEAVGESKVTWLIEPEGAACRLTLIHEDLADVPYVEGFLDGWSRIMSSLKTVLETGETFTF